MRGLFAIFLGFWLLLVQPAFAVNPDEMLKDSALEARARHLSAQLRCMVCQNQSIDDSNAELARDLRILVRERIVKGDSDDDVIRYLVSRYGEFVLLKPRLTSETLLLWGAPGLLLVVGAGAAFVYSRRRRSVAAVQPLSADEEARLKRLLEE
ncbi:cytochrome c-type biogenesis protein CcmH [Agrobacterium vitis]|uniref:cytochrome c-type biogenesis protein n=1 Tax=Allorhizobium ampelinum TaxID=3025782 RepID=UPI001F15ACB4|nr:cytochrome c-type biogenesis protein [Allorhizobium ampelinum]MCF1460023.1 cytochrome c-type biogenesis protein CcmH [Allorhizobium ampelinum]